MTVASTGQQWPPPAPGRVARHGRRLTVLAVATAASIGAVAVGQQQVPSRVALEFNRFYDYEQMTTALQALAQAYPDLLTLQSIGTSEQGRQMWLMTLQNRATGGEFDKPAMWIDGNVHGNEIQAAETVLYSIWYLAKSHGQIEALTQLIDRSVFYFLPMVNPDGRAAWFGGATDSDSFRSGQRPTDNDFDGLVDEDGAEDLDGDGHVGEMWRADPNGTHRRSADDPRVFERIDPAAPNVAAITDRYSRIGSEGIDNDGDGQFNEDGPGGYDMNRNWPADWQPNFVQFGAGDHPFSFPETRAVGQFIMTRPNIAAGQSFHNAGGMILRGPGAASRSGEYPRDDLAVYERLGRAGEEMLPFYRYMIIHADLYTVHGGFINWLAESLGVISFTNELWSDQRILQAGDGRLDDAQRFRWMDRMLFGQTFTDWTEFEHPQLGRVLIGGATKFGRRIPPPFMLEEECHRNFAFTMFHAGQMPRLKFSWVDVKSLGGDVWQLTIEVSNEGVIATRTERAASRRIGQPDRLRLRGEGVAVLTSGTLRDRFDRAMEPVEHRPWIIESHRGVPSQGQRAFRVIVKGPAGAAIIVRYEAEKATDLEQTVFLQPAAATAP